MTASPTSNAEKYAIYSQSEEGRDDYVVKHPETALPVARETLESPWCHEPLVLELSEAQALAAHVSAQTGEQWRVHLAPNPCPKCKRGIWADDHDFCYPSKQGEMTHRAGCNVHDFGCGHEVHGTSYRDVMSRWNSPST